MRAWITQGGASGREWIIVSRWGSDGQYLSVARTFRAAHAEGGAPIDLTPVWTTVAHMLRLPPASHACFLLQRRAPARISVAGAFTPAEGHIRLSGERGPLRLFAEGRYPRHADKSGWRITAIQQSWIGEYIDPGVSR